MVLNVEYASETSWIEVCKKVKNSLVFIDDCSAECLHWHGGLQRLLKSGALGVREFSSFEGGTAEYKKGVFLVKSPLVGPPRMILRDIISNSSFEHCIVITPCSPVVLTLATTGNVPDNSHESTALHKLERDILHWMKNQEYTVEIFHFSYGFVPLNEHFFISPAFNDFFPCFEEDLGFQNIQNSKYPAYEWDMESLPLEMQVAVTYLMTTLNSLLSQLNVREDIYCLGPMSTLIGAQLQKHSTSHLRSKTATSTMSVLLIDRTLDLCRPVFFENDCILDVIKSVLPPFPSHTIDVAVDMTRICATKLDVEETLIYPGCLHEPKSPMFDWLFSHSVPEILSGISKEMSNILPMERKKISLIDLETIIDSKIAQKFDLIRDNTGILQFTLGILQTLQSKAIEKIKLTRSFQMLLMQVLASDNKTDEAIRQITELIKLRKSKSLDLEHIFYILIFFYSFIGDKFEINSDLEALLMTETTKAVLEDKDNYNNGRFNFDSVTNLDEFCGLIFKKLHSLKECRKKLHKYREVAVYEDTMMPMEYKSVMYQLLQDIASPIKTEIPDLRHKPNLSLRDNFASRFSMLLNSARPHITDNESLMVFVLGGITGQEVKLIKNFFRIQGKPVIIGSTALLSPSDLVKKVLLNDPLKPFSL